MVKTEYWLQLDGSKILPCLSIDPELSESNKSKHSRNSTIFKLEARIKIKFLFKVFQKSPFN